MKNEHMLSRDNNVSSAIPPKASVKYNIFLFRDLIVLKNQKWISELQILYRR